MKSSAILTRAAELVDANIQQCCCYALWDVIGTSNGSNAEEMFHAYLFDDAHIGFRSTPTGSYRQQHRVLALLLCAAIAEDSGD